jgi:hypothetical protein
MASLPLHQFTRFFRFFNDTTKYLETLGDNVLPVIAKIFPNGGYIFQDDNAPCHASRRAVQWKRENANILFSYYVK